MSQYWNYTQSIEPKIVRRTFCPPGTTANTATAIAKLLATVAGICLIFTAIFYAVSNFI